MNRGTTVGWTVAAVIALGVAGWAMGTGGWPGEPSACIAAGDCACEAFSGEIVRQPINTISSLVFALTGLVLLWFVPAGATDRRRRVSYAVSVVGLGVGSAAFHASMTEWSGWLDLIGIHLFLGCALLVTVAGLMAVSDREFFASAVIGGAVFAAALWIADNSLGKYTAAALVVAICLVEWLGHRRLRRPRKWLWLATSLFAVGLAVQWLGRSGGPWCDPDRVFQPHAMWHGIAALGAVALYRHLFGPGGTRYQVPGSRYD